VLFETLLLEHDRGRVSGQANAIDGNDQNDVPDWLVHPGNDYLLSAALIVLEVSDRLGRSSSLAFQKMSFQFPPL
jgi:hypothetical protein